MRRCLLLIYFIVVYLLTGETVLKVGAQSTSIFPGQIPVPGKPVYIKQSNSLWVFSFSKNIPADNKLSFIDLNQGFNTLSPPVVDLSSLITNNQCPVMHFAQAMPSNDGVSVNIFGAGSDINGIYESTMTLCQLNTQTKTWKEIKPNNAPPARRNAALELTQSGLTFIWGGSSEAITGLSANAQGYPFYWHQDVSIYDPNNGWVNGPSYNGPPRANATMTQISDTNGQMVIIGGVAINNNSVVDMVTNSPLANMSEIIVLDPRTSSWTNIIANGPAPPPRKHHTATLHPDGHTLVVIGGENFNASGAYVLNDVWTLDTRNMNNYTWSQPVLSGGPGLFRSNHTSVLIGDQIWIIAGTNNSAKAVDFQLLNVTNWTWSYNAVSNFVPAPSFANIGGVKGLVGIIVGVIGGVLLLSSCLIFWWCRRRRVNPSSKKNNSQQPVPPAHGNMTYMNGQHQQMLPQEQLYHSDSYHHQDTSTVDNSKITSRPSMSTTTSGGIVALSAAGAGNWSSPQHMNSFVTTTTSPTSHTTISNSYYIPQYTSGPPPITTTMPDQYYNGNGHENYYTDGSYYNNVAGYGDAGGADAVYTPVGGGIGSTTIGAVYSTDTPNRQSFGFYDIPTNGGAPPQHQLQQSLLTPSSQQFPDHNFMLTPMNNDGGPSSRPTSRLHQPQQLQKPNEVDTTNLEGSPTAGSTTVYTSSANEESRSVTPGNSDNTILYTNTGQ